MHGALIAAVCVYSATQFAGADVKIVSEMIKSNANIKKHIYAYIYIYNSHDTRHKKDFQICWHRRST